MTRWWWLHPLVVVASLAWGESARAEVVGSVSSAVTSAEPDRGDDAVVALVYAGERAPRCTGSLIAEDVVLTAAHCVAKGQPSAVLFGGASVPVADAFMHPTYDPQTFADDLAIVRLAFPVPIMPVPLAHMSDKDEGMTVKVVGYGVVAGGGASAETGVKREGTSKLADLGTHAFRLQAEPSQPCLGDSGGPVFLLGTDGRSYLVGVTSHGDFGCTERAYAVRVGAYDDFIRPYVARSAGTTGGCSVGASSGLGGAAPWCIALATVLFARKRAQPRELSFPVFSRSLRYPLGPRWAVRSDGTSCTTKWLPAGWRRCTLAASSGPTASSASSP